MVEDNIVIKQNENWLLSNGKEKFFLTNNIDGEDFQIVNLPYMLNVKSSDCKYTEMCYTKLIHIDKKYNNKSIYLEFNGVCSMADVYVNFRHIPYSFDNPYNSGNIPEYVHKGCASFRFDITKYVVWGQENIVTILVKNELTDIFYSSKKFSDKLGIYGDLFLVIADRLNLYNN